MVYRPAGRLPRLHYIVERPDRNSTERTGNFFLFRVPEQRLWRLPDEQEFQNIDGVLAGELNIRLITKPGTRCCDWAVD